MRLNLIYRINKNTDIGTAIINKTLKTFLNPKMMRRNTLVKGISVKNILGVKNTEHTNESRKI